MGIDRRGGITGKMFSATRDALRTQCIVKSACQPNDFVDRSSVAATAERVIRFVVEGNIENRTKIEIETKKSKQPAGESAMLPNESNIALLPKLLRIGRFFADKAQTRDSAAFLVDRNDRLDRAQVAQVVDQFSQLRRAFDVATEKDVAARLHFAEEGGGGGIKFFPGNSGEDQLTRGSALHKVASYYDGRGRKPKRIR